MWKTMTLYVAMASVVGLAILDGCAAEPLRAQEKPAPTPSLSTKMSEQKLSEQEMRGEGLFLQRCSLCHLPRKLKFGSPTTAGPVLSGLFKEADTDQTKILRTYILKGGPGMPGFQYGLEPKEVDDLVAFLKSF